MAEHIYYLPGRQVGREKWIVNLLRASGPRALYKVKDKEGEFFTLKVCHRDAAPSREHHRKNIERLEREYAALSLLRALPCFQYVHDFSMLEEDALLMMEFLEGTPFPQFLAKRPPLRQALQAFLEICQAVALIHSQGFCHRDLQPDNFFIRQDGQPVVLDFGACLPPIFDTITTPGELIGSPYSISPEYVAYLLAGGDREHYVATPAEDVYALGVTLYEILTGTVPYQAHAAIDLLHEIRSGAPTHPCDVRPDAKVPRPLGDFALTLMEKDPAKRPPTALLVAGKLKGLLTEAERQLWGRTPEQRPAPTAASSVRLRDEVQAEVECMPPRALIDEAAALAAAAERPSGPLATPGPVSTIDYPVPWEASMPLVRNRTLQFVAASVFTVLVGLLLYTAQHAVSTSRQALELARELAASAVEPISALAVTGLSMPEKPLPKWMLAPPGTKPGTVCPGTNRRLIAYRGACWTSAYNSRRLDDPKALCPDTWFDPPPETLPEHKDFCFYPVAPDRPGAATP